MVGSDLGFEPKKWFRTFFPFLDFIIEMSYWRIFAKRLTEDRKFCFATCNLCGREYKVFNSSTGGLSRHISNLHPDALEPVENIVQDILPADEEIVTPKLYVESLPKKDVLTLLSATGQIKRSTFSTPLFRLLGFEEADIPIRQYVGTRIKEMNTEIQEILLGQFATSLTNATFCH